MQPIKINFAFILIVLFSSTIVFSQVGIGTSSPNASAMLDVDVSSLPSNGKKGFLPPRLTTTQRNAISSPATGLLIYNSTTNNLNYYTGSAWTVIDTSSGSFVDLSTQQTVGGNKNFTGTITASGRLMIPMGEISYFKTAGHNVTIPLIASGASGLLTNDNMVKINPGTANTAFINDMFGGSSIDFADSRLTYQGAVRRNFHIALSFSYSPEISKDVFIFAVGKNGLVQDSSKLFITTGNTSDFQSTAMHVLLELNPTDYIEFFVGNLTTANKYVKIKSFNFVAIGM